MLNKAKRILGLFLAMMMLLSIPVMAETAEINAAYDVISVRVNGNYINAPSYIYGDYAYVPLRAVSEAMGAEVLWDDETKSIAITTNATEPRMEPRTFTKKEGEAEVVSFQAHTNYVKVSIDGQEQMLPHFLYNGTTYVPVSVFYDYFGCHVMQEPYITLSVRIYSPDYKTFNENEVLWVDDTVYNDTQIQWLSLEILGKQIPETLWDYADIELTMMVSNSYVKLGEAIVSKDGYEDFYRKNDLDSVLKAYDDEQKQFIADTLMIPNYYLQALTSETELVENYLNPTDSDLEAYLKTTEFAQGRWLKAKHILINKTEDESGLQQAEKILAMLKENPADFDKLMAQYSEDPDSMTEPDGYIFTEGVVVTEFYEGALSLQVGEISEIVESPYGYHIILKVADYENGLPLEEVKEEIKTLYATVKINDLLLNTIAETDTVLNRAVVEKLNEK